LDNYPVVGPNWWEEVVDERGFVGKKPSVPLEFAGSGGG